MVEAELYARRESKYGRFITLICVSVGIRSDVLKVYRLPHASYHGWMGDLVERRRV